MRKTVIELLAELDGPRAESALCALRGLREALPLVAEAYGRESDGQRRESLVHCLWQFRDIAALPTLSAALRDPDDHVWKEALDGIVTLGGDAALGVLEEARDALGEESAAKTKRQWIEEAIGQIREDNESGQV